jgi:hypothetical protein
MTEAEKLAAIAALLPQWQSGELSSYDFAWQVEKIMEG